MFEGGGQSQQQDFSNEWIQYFRSIGQHQQADMLEQQTKAAKAAADPNPGPPGVQPQQASQQPGPPGAAAPASNGAPAAGPAADYSMQWAEHYRSMGKVQEAEAIEAYIKAQKVCLCVLCICVGLSPFCICKNVSLL